MKFLTNSPYKGFKVRNVIKERKTKHSCFVKNEEKLVEEEEYFFFSTSLRKHQNVFLVREIWSLSTPDSL